MDAARVAHGDKNLCLLNCGSICLIQAYYSGTQTGAPVLSDTCHPTFLLFPMNEGHRGHQTIEEHPEKSDDKKRGGVMEPSSC